MPIGETATTASEHTRGECTPIAIHRGSQLYKRRGATVEPGIGNLKKILDTFSRRG